MKQIKWVKYWTRSFGLFRYWVYVESNRLPFYKKCFGKIFNYTLTAPNGKLVEYYHDQEELRDLTDIFFKVSCKDFITFQKYSKQIFAWMQDFIDFNNKFDYKKFEQVPNKKFVAVFNEWYEKYLHWQIGVYFYFVLESIITENLLVRLKNYLNKNNQENFLTKYTEIIMAPEVMNAVTLEQRFALATAIKIKKQPSREVFWIQKYYEHFVWIPCYDIKDKAYNLSYFKQQINKLLKLSLIELEEKLITLEQEFALRRERFKGLLREVSDDKRLCDLAQIMHWLAYYRDLRDDKRREASYAGKRFMGPLAKRFGLTLEEINYLTPPEVAKWLSTGMMVSKKEIKRRMPANYVLQGTPAGIKLFVGKDAQKLLAKELKIENAGGNQIVKGMVGSKGVAKGKVVIVRHSVSLNKVKEGDVLVAVTTHPEYVPAMRKAAAIVTDEGGVLSHAAIVAREMKKPCIIGTKIATKVFKDGDIVEVDAERGIVKKINP